MFKRILVPTDGSDITAHAVDTAIQLAKVHGAQLLTLSVMEPFPYSAVSEIQPVPPQEFLDAQQRVATKRVEVVSAAYMETCIEDDEIGERMDAGRRALLQRGDNEVGPYQSPMEDGMQHFHEWFREQMGEDLGASV